MPEQAGYFPHPIAAEATHAEADLPNVPPATRTIPENDYGCVGGLVGRAAYSFRKPRRTGMRTSRKCIG